MDSRWPLGLVLLAGCAGGPPREAASPTPPASPHVELVDVRLNEGAGKTKAWDLHAERVSYRASPRAADMHGVDARFYEEGEVASEATAPAAVLREDARRLALTGGIHVAAPRERAGLEASEVVWRPEVGRLEATGPVRYWRPGSRLQAARLTADRGLRQVALSGGVTGRLALPAGEPFPPVASSAILGSQRGARP